MRKPSHERQKGQEKKKYPLLFSIETNTAQIFSQLINKTKTLRVVFTENRILHYFESN